MTTIPRFQGLRSLLREKFSTLTQMTGKEYCKLARIFLVAVTPLFIHYPDHLDALQAGLDFLLLAGYQSHSDTTLFFLEKSLWTFDALKWVFAEQHVGSSGLDMGHFDIPKLHALTHYSNWIKAMGTLDNVNTAPTKALHKTVRAAFCHSNKVDFLPQICFWDDQRLSVEMRKATLSFLALEYIGFWSDIIQGPFDLEPEVRPALPLLAGLQPYIPLAAAESNT